MQKLIFSTVQMIATLLLLSLLAFSAYGEDGKQLYEQTCSPCHGMSGKGDGPTARVLQPKPANLTTVLKDKNDAYLMKLLKGGGPSVGKSPLMPSYQDLLSEEQIQSLIQYIKGFVAQ